MPATPVRYLSVLGASAVLEVSSTVVRQEMKRGRLRVAATAEPRGSPLFAPKDVKKLATMRAKTPLKRGGPRKPAKRVSAPAANAPPKRYLSVIGAAAILQVSPSIVSLEVERGRLRVAATTADHSRSYFEPADVRSLAKLRQKHPLRPGRRPDKTKQGTNR